MPIIACHAGTGTGTVQEILADYGYDLAVVNSRHVAAHMDFDGLILLGGADISPLWYGEYNTYCGHRDQERDMIEWLLVRRAIDQHLPIMGICRGHQMLAVACGGSLYQDIALQAGRAHRGSTHKLQDVKLPLRRYMPSGIVNSLHHQAVRRIPPGFEAVALSTDGIVEAIWRPGMLGVQFHPELLYAQQPKWASLFEWFLNGLV